MPESLIIKDGNGTERSLQVNNGETGYVSNHTLVSTVTGSNVNIYYENSGWNYSSGPITQSVAAYDQNRKAVIINNNSEGGKCYVLMGNSDFGNIPSFDSPPQKYTFLLEAGGVYFGDSSTSALEHHICVPSSSYSVGGQMTVAVTQIY